MYDELNTGYSSKMQIVINEFGENESKIPSELKSKLDEAYLRYEHFIGITSRVFAPWEIEEERKKYAYLLLPEREGLPVFGEEECVEYMHAVSGVSKIWCLIYSSPPSWLLLELLEKYQSSEQLEIIRKQDVANW